LGGEGVKVNRYLLRVCIYSHHQYVTAPAMSFTYSHSCVILCAARHQTEGSLLCTAAWQ